MKRHHSRLYGLFLLTLLVSSGCLPSGWQQRQENEEQLSFQFTMPGGWSVINADHTGRVTQMDTNGDDEKEWVLLYAFDTPGNAAFTPVRCAIYHTVRREPRLPIVYPYHLQAPGWTYLGEGTGRVTVRVDDVVTDIEPDETYPMGTLFAPQEVIVEGKNASGHVTRVSIFQWRNTVPKEYRKRIDPEEHIVVPSEPPGSASQWYQCIGLFEGTVAVYVGKDEVTVSDRINDRSQFARVKTYKPNAATGGYLYGGQDLVEPTSSCVGFAFGMPADVAQSPFPEKIVMAFHRQFRDQAAGHGDAFLTDSAKDARAGEPDWDLFSLSSQSSAQRAQRACVKTLRYGSELDSEIRSFGASIDSQGTDQKPAPITTQVETQAEYHLAGDKVKLVRIVWEMVKEDDGWKINDIIETE